MINHYPQLTPLSVPIGLECVGELSTVGRVVKSMVRYWQSIRFPRQAQPHACQYHHYGINISWMAANTLRRAPGFKEYNLEVSDKTSIKLLVSMPIGRQKTTFNSRPFIADRVSNVMFWLFAELNTHAIEVVYPALAPHPRSLLPRWRHQMETFSALLAICAGNSPVPGEFPTQRPVTRIFDVFFDLHPKKR